MPRAEKDSNFRSIKDAALAQGWTVKKTKKNHYQFIPPGDQGEPVFFSGSPGEWRALANFVARLRRNGFRPPARNRKNRKKKR